MKRKFTSKSAFFSLRVETSVVVGLASLCLAFVGFSAFPKALPRVNPPRKESDTIHEDPAARAAWERLRLQDEYGQISPTGLRRAYEFKKTMPFRPEAWAEFLPKNSMGQREAVQSIWSSIGPGNIGGRTRSIIIHPTDPNIIWLGAVGGGVWKTTNAGSSWTTTTDFLANLAVNCMAIDPTNCNRLYAGTGEPYPFDGILGDGIFKTGDGGITWIQMSSTASNPDFQNVTRLAIAYYAPIRHTVLLVGTTTGLFRTTTDGIRWSQVRTGHINTLVFQPNNAANCLASIGLGGRYGNDFGGIFYSTDVGATWTLSTITTNKPVTGRVELAYAPSDPSGSIVYASADDYASPALSAGELLKSTNGGRTFAPTNITNTLDVIGWYANTLWVDPTNPYVVLVGGADLFRCTSTDGGITFNKVKIGGIDRGDHVDHHVIINDPNYNGSDNRIAFVATDGGIYNTNDILAPNVQWTSLNHTLGITQFYGGAANSTGDTIIGGTQDTGTLRYRSQYGSEQWDVMSGSDTNSASDGGFCAWTGGIFMENIRFSDSTEVQTAVTQICNSFTAQVAVATGLLP